MARALSLGWTSRRCGACGGSRDAFALGVSTFFSKTCLAVTSGLCLTSCSETVSLLQHQSFRMPPVFVDLGSVCLSGKGAHEHACTRARAGARARMSGRAEGRVRFLTASGMFLWRCFVPRNESRRSFRYKGGVTRGREDHSSGKLVPEKRGSPITKKVCS